MSLDKIIVAAVSLLGIIFTYWFFLGKKGSRTQISDEHKNHH